MILLVYALAFHWIFLMSHELAAPHIQYLRQHHYSFALLIPGDLIQMDFEVFQSLHSTSAYWEWIGLASCVHEDHWKCSSQLAWQFDRSRFPWSCSGCNYLRPAVASLESTVKGPPPCHPPKTGDILDIRARSVRETEEEHRETHQGRTE